MKGVSIEFTKNVQVDVDEMNNPVNSDVLLVVEDCLVAPIIEPATAREQQAMHQARDQVRIHLPKKFDGDVSDSNIVWDGKVFRVDSDSVVFMPENTPTRWNRYFRAEFVANYSGSHQQSFEGFITEDRQCLFVSENRHYYFVEEVVS